MTRMPFDDSRLDAPRLFEDSSLRWLASAGSRIRHAALQEAVGPGDVDKPRGVLVMGSEARLVRAVLEPVCPVPFMAWPGPSLPAWVGALDLVVLIGGRDAPRWQLQCAAEAARRGATIIVAAPETSALTAAASSHSTTSIPAEGDDPVAAAVAVLARLGNAGLGPEVHAESVADAADLVAESCSPHRDLASNPAKELAIGLAEKLPLIWGGTVLAQRASRRIAEALRRASGRLALAADADELDPLLRAVEPVDLFSDPFESEDETRPVLLMLDEENAPDRMAHEPRHLLSLAEAVGVRVCRISSGEPELANSDLERYVTLLQHGRYAAAYLGIGNGSSGEEL